MKRRYAWIALFALGCGSGQSESTVVAPTAAAPAHSAESIVIPPVEAGVASDDNDSAMVITTEPSAVATDAAPPPPPTAPTPEEIRANVSLQKAAGAICPAPTGRAPPSSLSSLARGYWSTSRRGVALLITEIQQLESLFQSVQPTAKDHPTIERRLALDYYELEAAAYRDCAATSTPAMGGAADALNREARVRARGKTIAAARNAGIKYCTLLQGDHPAYAAANTCPVQ